MFLDAGYEGEGHSKVQAIDEDRLKEATWTRSSPS